MLTKYVNHQSAFFMKLCAAAHCCTKSFSGPLMFNLNIRHLALLANSTERAVHRGINAVLALIYIIWMGCLWSLVVLFGRHLETLISTLVNNTTSGTTMVHVLGADCLLRGEYKILNVCNINIIL